MLYSAHSAAFIPYRKKFVNCRNISRQYSTTELQPVADKQPQPSCRFSIQAVLRGFPITIEGEGRAGDLKLIVERLLAAGAEPPQSAQPEPKLVKALPLCPAHGTPMKPSRKPGSYFCPRRDDMGDYCPHKT